MSDLYTSSFYPFKTQEEKWAYWSKHINYVDTSRKATKLYKNIFNLVKDKNYFVITTNVENQFYKSGFNKDKIFATQGSYSLNQCVKGCHDKLYDNHELILNMVDSIDSNLKISADLVPKCPVCGSNMDINIRKDQYFVEDDIWRKQNKAYQNFINQCKNEKTLFMEFGVGYNTPSIIRFPFEQMVFNNKKWTLARFNKENLEIAVEINKSFKLLTLDMLKELNIEHDFFNRYIPVNSDINVIIDELLI